MSLPTCPSCVYATHKCKKTGVTIGRTTGCTYHEPKPQTNADRIRAMTDEELAKFLSKVERKGYKSHGEYHTVWEWWLQQEVKT